MIAWCWHLVKIRFVLDLAAINRVGQQCMYTAFVKRASALGKAFLRVPQFVLPATLVELFDNGIKFFSFEVEREDCDVPWWLPLD